MHDPDQSIGEELAEWGKVMLLETRGRVTGLPRSAAVGFAEEPDGSLLIAATDERTHWALNLLVEPRCSGAREGRSERYRAEPLDDEAHHAAVRALILKYGTPAERLGAGPAFRLVPDGT